MKIKSSIVLAAAGSAFAPNAGAADLPVKAQRLVPVASPVWSWTGFYVGGHLGYAWQENRTSGSYVDDGGVRFPFTNSTDKSGFMGGGQIGYNWQAGSFVYGLEADISYLSGSRTAAQVVGIPNDTATVTSSGRISWLGTVRGRVGALVGINTLLYATGGFAYGKVRNDHSEVDRSQNDFATWQDHSTRTGYAVGGGVEHMFMQNWTVKLEGLYVDLGKKTVGAPTTGNCDNSCDPVAFSNNVAIVRGGINFKF